MEIRHLGPADDDLLLSASHLFDHPPTADLARSFLEREGHHCLLAIVDGEPAGFVTGIEIRHPDKQPEMLLHELGVDEHFRRRGIGTALVGALRDLAIERSFRGMWVLTEPDNEPAIRTYESAGNPVDSETTTLIEWPL